MVGLLLGILILALFAYGDWLMARLDRSVFHADCRHAVRMRSGNSFRTVFHPLRKRWLAFAQSFSHRMFL